MPKTEDLERDYVSILDALIAVQLKVNAAQGQSKIVKFATSHGKTVIGIVSLSDNANWLMKQLQERERLIAELIFTDHCLGPVVVQRKAVSCGN